MDSNLIKVKQSRRGIAKKGLNCVEEAAQMLLALEPGAQNAAGDAKHKRDRLKLVLVKPELQQEERTVQAGNGNGCKKGTGQRGKIPPGLVTMVDEAITAGLMSATARPAALSLAGQIARLESRFEQYYSMGEQDEEARRAQSTPDTLDKMGKCEKQLADLKARFFEMAGLDRQYAARAQLAELQCRAAEADGEVLVKLEGFGEIAVQEG
jgi:hypothetical protein